MNLRRASRLSGLVRLPWSSKSRMAPDRPSRPPAQIRRHIWSTMSFQSCRCVSGLSGSQISESLPRSPEAP
jgi:hypothetical protein